MIEIRSSSIRNRKKDNDVRMRDITVNIDLPVVLAHSSRTKTTASCLRSGHICRVEKGENTLKKKRLDVILGDGRN